MFGSQRKQRESSGDVRVMLQKKLRTEETNSNVCLQREESCRQQTEKVKFYFNTDDSRERRDAKMRSYSGRLPTSPAARRVLCLYQVHVMAHIHSLTVMCTVQTDAGATTETEGNKEV